MARPTVGIGRGRPAFLSPRQCLDCTSVLAGRMLTRGPCPHPIRERTPGVLAGGGGGGRDLPRHERFVSSGVELMVKGGGEDKRRRATCATLPLLPPRDGQQPRIQSARIKIINVGASSRPGQEHAAGVETPINALGSPVGRPREAQRETPCGWVVSAACRGNKTCYTKTSTKRAIKKLANTREERNKKRADGCHHRDLSHSQTAQIHTLPRRIRLSMCTYP